MEKKHEANGAFLKEFFTLALPIALGNLFTFGVGFASHFMTAALGREISVGIFLSNQVHQMLVFVITGIEATVSILGSQSIGEGDERSFSKTVFKSAALALFVSVLLTIICIFAPNGVLSLFSVDKDVGNEGAVYLRTIAISFPLYSLSRVLISALKCLDRPRIALLAPAASFVFTLALCAILTGPVKLGALGAGISVLCGRAAELSAVIISEIRAKAQRSAPYSVSERGNTRLNATHPSHKERSLSASEPDREQGKLPSLLGSLLPTRKARLASDAKTEQEPRGAFTKSLLPIMLGQVGWAAESMLMTALMSRVDGGEAAAAFGALSALSNLAYCFMNASSGAVGIIISRLVGEGKEQEARQSAARAEVIFLSVGTVGAILILILTGPFMHLYRLPAEDAALLGELSPILALTFVALTYSAASLFGIIKSGGSIGFTLAVDLSVFLLLTLPLSLSAYLGGAGVTALYTTLRLGHLVKCPIAYSRIRQGEWAVRLTNPR